MEPLGWTAQPDAVFGFDGGAYDYNKTENQRFGAPENPLNDEGWLFTDRNAISG